MPQLNNLSQPTTPSLRISRCRNKQLQKFLDLKSPATQAQIPMRFYCMALVKASVKRG